MSAYPSQEEGVITTFKWEHRGELVASAFFFHYYPLFYRPCSSGIKKGRKKKIPISVKGLFLPHSVLVFFKAFIPDHSFHVCI